MSDNHKSPKFPLVSHESIAHNRIGPGIEFSLLNSDSTVAQNMKLEREKSLTVQICKSIV